MKRLLSGLLILLLAIAVLAGCAGDTQEQPQTSAAETMLSTAASESDIETDEAETQTAETEALQEDTETEVQETEASAQETEIDEYGYYTSKEEVALYLYTYGHLPENYLTKKEAQALGWDNKKGNLQDVAPGMSIGGDKFGNREGLLPDASGRQYYECDIDYEGGYRGAKRIIYSNDGLIFYTEDHYESFEQLYGE